MSLARSLWTPAHADAHRRAVWSNFEIANMEFWRGEAYTKFFDHLDKTGGFYYEVRVVSCIPRGC